MPLKIVAIGQFPPPVSGFSLITERFVAVAGERHRVEVRDIAAAPGTRGLSKALSRVGRTLAAGLALARGVATRDRCCYIACEGNWGLLYTVTLLALARLFGYRTYLHHHSFRYVDRADRLMRLLLRLGGRVHHVFLCNTMRVRFEATYGRAVLGSIVSNAAFVPPVPLATLPAATGPVVLGHLSNLTCEKGLHTFLDLLRAARDAGLDVRGVLAGPIAAADDRALVEQAQAELGDRLDYRGSVYGNDKMRFYRDAEVFVFPTRYVNEAQPTVLFEAQSAGHAILSYDRGCIAAQVGEFGLVAERDGAFVEPALAWLARHAGSGAARAALRRDIAGSYSAEHALARQSAIMLFEQR